MKLRSLIEAVSPQLKKLFSNWEELLIGKPIESKPWSSDHHDSPSSPHHRHRYHHRPITAIENTTIPSSCKRLGRVSVAERGISGVCKSFPFTQMPSFSLISLKFKRLLSLHFSQPLAPALLTPILLHNLSFISSSLKKKALAAQFLSTLAVPHPISLNHGLQFRPRVHKMWRTFSRLQMKVAEYEGPWWTAAKKPNKSPLSQLIAAKNDLRDIDRHCLWLIGSTHSQIKL